MIVRVTIIQTLSDNNYVIRCERCGGSGKRATGWFKDSDGSIKIKLPVSGTCPICSGKGVIRIASDDIPVFCKACYTSGVQLRETGEEVIGGSFKQIYYSDGDCPQCAGLGVQSLSGKIRIIH